MPCTNWLNVAWQAADRWIRLTVNVFDTHAYED